MSTTIELRLERGLNSDERGMLRYLLNDALGEFIGQREDVDAYVAKRYPDYSEAQRTAKILEVRKRIELARVIKNCDITVK